MSGWTDTQLFSSKKQDWGTPKALFNALNSEFNFALDAAATSSNAKCPAYLTVEDDALRQDWNVISQGASVWLNPPYGKAIGTWVEKAYRESLKGCIVVVLTFCRTDTKWWHQWAMKAAEIRLVVGRVTFEGAKNCAPAPSCVLVFDGETQDHPVVISEKLPRK